MTDEGGEKNLLTDDLTPPLLVLALIHNGPLLGKMCVWFLPSADERPGDRGIILPRLQTLIVDAANWPKLRPFFLKFFLDETDCDRIS
jgi:hypothetical protein